MKKFEYNLSSLLKLRSHKVKEAENELGKILSEKFKREDQVKLYKKEINELLSANTGNAIAFMNARFSRIDMLHSLIDELIKEIKNISEIESIQREKLAEVSKEEKILETHKEKRFDEYVEEYKKDENAFIDEVAGRISQSQNNDKQGQH